MGPSQPTVCQSLGQLQLRLPVRCATVAPGLLLRVRLTRHLPVGDAPQEKAAAASEQMDAKKRWEKEERSLALALSDVASLYNQSSAVGLQSSLVAYSSNIERVPKAGRFAPKVPKGRITLLMSAEKPGLSIGDNAIVVKVSEGSAGEIAGFFVGDVILRINDKVFLASTFLLPQYQKV